MKKTIAMLSIAIFFCCKSFSQHYGFAVHTTFHGLINGKNHFTFKVGEVVEIESISCPTAEKKDAFGEKYSMYFYFYTCLQYWFANHSNMPYAGVASYIKPPNSKYADCPTGNEATCFLNTREQAEALREKLMSQWKENGNEIILIP